MKHYLDFSSSQLRVVVFLVCLLVVVSALRILRGFSQADRHSLRLVVQVSDGDTRYAPIFKVDLNLSPADSLELVPGIGPVLASRIVSYRDSAGRFENIRDVIEVDGIGYKTYEKIKPYLEVRQW
ncbi:MAG: helix-hairpin-helix domain-containing protein [Candidatus Zixiibacteriota bacterium]|nr:MAG: helix-hairpin-helix domain-containing protein [candidate division Zixibacteria bacterium]